MDSRLLSLCGEPLEVLRGVRASTGASRTVVDSGRSDDNLPILHNFIKAALSGMNEYIEINNKAFLDQICIITLSSIYFIAFFPKEVPSELLS